MSYSDFEKRASAADLKPRQMGPFDILETFDILGALQKSLSWTVNSAFDDLMYTVDFRQGDNYTI